MAEMTSSAALSDTNTRGILWDDPFEEDIDQGPSNIQSLDAMKGDDNGDQPEEDPGEDVKNNTKGTGKAAKSKRKKQQRHKHGVRTTQAPAQDGENDDKDSTDNDSISARAGGADTSHKGKGKNAIVRLDPLGEDENGDADGDGGIGDRYQIAGDTSAEQAVGRKGGRSRPSKAATGTLSTAPRSSHNKRKRGDVSESKPRRSSRAAAIFATAQITEQSVKRPKAHVAPVAASASKGKATASNEATPASQHKAKAPAGKSARGQKPEYEVDKIVNSRLDKATGSVEYLVKWAGYPSSANTWEPADNLTHCRQKLARYHSAQRAK